MELAEAKNLARMKMIEHGVGHWNFAFDNGTRRVGATNFRTRTISLSRHFTVLNNEQEMLNTILHEIAHALVGSGHGHDAVWRAKAREIGDDGRRTSKAVAPEGRYRLTCPGCGHVTSRMRKTDSSLACITCCNRHSGGRWSREFVFVWVDTKAPAMV
jgi:predicted SprT family Zn-dependent metalloprotease